MVKFRNSANELRITPKKISRFLCRTIHAVYRSAILGLQNLFSKELITSNESDFVVCIASYGARIRTVHSTIESIAAGTVKPKEIWLIADEEDLLSVAGSVHLQRLISRGLKVTFEDASLRAHKKYYPYVKKFWDKKSSLVLADDDFFYAKNWLSEMQRVSNATEEELVVSWWLKKPRIQESVFLPYSTWPTCDSSATGGCIYFMGGSGTVLSPSVLNLIVEYGERFRDVAPFADDIWLNWVVFQSGIRVAPASTESFKALSVLGTQASKLSTVNVIGGLNDRQLADTFSSEDIERWAASAK